jgi:glycosyltransferase involved in cell wall biosynthesis
MSNPYFTIFTPVYNGAEHLHRVFLSVKGQTFRDFEWIIVNDGSVDGTEMLIQDFINQNPTIKTIYISQPNLGKHIAWNKAVSLAKGTLFVPADADDSFDMDTLAFYYRVWEGLSAEKQNSLSGINVLCFDNDSDNIVGSRYPSDVTEASNLELIYKHKMHGEKWGCIRVDLLRERLFPDVEGACAPLSYLWLSLSKKHKILCFNHALRRYYTTPTGITQTAHKNRYTVAKSKLVLAHNYWLMRHFGLYVLRNSPKDFLQMVCSTVLRSLVLLGNRVKKV